MRPLIIKALTLFLILCTTIPLAATADLAVEPSKITSGRIAATYTENGNSDIYVINFEDSVAKPIVQTPATDEHPAWSPDGTQLVYSSNVSRNPEIYLVNSDGSQVKKLTHNLASDKDPHWSPDGSQIVFQSNRLEQGRNIFVMNVNGSQVRALTKSFHKNTMPKWSPRKDEILYSSNSSWPGWDIMLYSFATNKSKRLTHGYRSFCRASWHPDGSKFAFSYGARNDVDIWIQKKGSEPTQLTSLPGRDYDPTWSEDGKRIFFVSELAKGAGNYQLYVAEVATKKIQKLSSATGSLRHPTWTPYPEVPHLQPPNPTPAEQQAAPTSYKPEPSNNSEELL